MPIEMHSGMTIPSTYTHNKETCKPRTWVASYQVSLILQLMLGQERNGCVLSFSSWRFRFYLNACVAVAVVAPTEEHPTMDLVVIMVGEILKAVGITETTEVLVVACPIYSGVSVVSNGAVEIVKMWMLAAV